MSERPGHPHESLLVGLRVRLRPVGPADYPHVYGWARQHPEAHFWREQRHALSFEDFCSERQANSVRELNAMLVEWRTSGRPIGWISARDRAPHARSCALVLCLTPAARAFGGADEALALFLDYAFATFWLDEIHIDVLELNVATELLARRLGFEVVGYLYQQWMIDDQYFNVVRLGLRRAKWEAARRRLP